MQSGWKVSIDGNPAQLVEADHAFTGVYVPAGSHRVEFSYKGKGLAIGLVVTGIALVILVGLWIFVRVRRRRATGDRPVDPVHPAAVAGSDT